MRATRLLSMRWWLPAAFALIAAVTALAVAQVFQAQTRTALRGKAEELGIPILDEAAFVRMLEHGVTR